MLIIAIPKSASTSLLVSLSKVSNLEGTQIWLHNYSKPKETKVIQNYHSDIRELDQNIVNIVCATNIICKQHFPPTKNNLECLLNHKKVILLRDPKEIVEAYYRAEKANIHKPRVEFVGIENIDDWNKRAKEIGLLNDLEWFYNNWDDGLIIQYKELISNPKFIINKIQEYFGLKVSNNIELSKLRYSRKIC